ncbi:MAG: NUDIX domain-containing protein [Chloroflexi bacterium]|nr:NUDIX domain-containing protein [Chloroflexota bacterium]
MSDEVTSVVTCFLRHGAKICLFKRSQLVGSNRGKWHGVSGYLPQGETPLRQALREIWEETGLSEDQLRLVRQGEPLRVYAAATDRYWVIHPFLFETASTDIHLDWEHVAAVWIEPEEMANYDCVNRLDEVYRAVTGEPSG